MSVHAGGTLLGGRYRLDEVIGRGGMSTVYRATDQVLGRTVAVKVLLAALAEQDPSYAARFEREARAAAALDDPTVVTVYDTGVDDDRHYIVMEYIAGRSLEQLLRDAAPLEVAEATRVAVAVAGALDSAHAAGILHRDIKPANVMLTEAGNVKVLDFGIARSLDGTAITQVASVVGTAAYLAPERALGEPGDARTDIYSLGCLLYAMLTGAPPFSGEVSAAVLHQQINASPRRPSQLRPGIPSALDALVLAMLAKAPDRRPGSAAQVHDELLGLSGAPVAAPLTAATRVMPRARPGLPVDHRRRAVVMALITAVITLVAVALLSGGGSSHPGKVRSRPAGTTSRPAVTQKPAPAHGQAPSTTPAPPASSTPPSQSGEPPGQAKKHGGNGKHGGDGGDGGDSGG